MGDQCMPVQRSYSANQGHEVGIPRYQHGNIISVLVGGIQDAGVGTTDFEFSLRAERSGTGDGRVYTVTYTATDASGNEASATATVIEVSERVMVIG